MKETGCLVFYYSSRESGIPVRDVRCNWHQGHKPEPNIETMTYGKYACCNCAARNTAKKDFKNGRKYIFFLTNYDPLDPQLNPQGRQIVGYYKLKKARKKECCDMRFETCWWWQGEEIKFCYPGLMLTRDSGLRKPQRFIIDWKSNSMSTWGPGRGFWKLEKDHVEILLKWFNARLRSQVISRKLWSDEVAKLERANISQYGFAYPRLRRKKGFAYIRAKCR
jgi:hypothetical protein